MTPSQYGLWALVLAVTVSAADPTVRLSLGSPRAQAVPGWLPWTVPVGKGGGPFTRYVPASLVDADGFTVAIGPAGALDLRAGGPCQGAAGEVLRESAFTRAEHPLELTFSGLRPGLYAVTLWLNDARGYVWPPVRIEVSDARGASRVAAENQPQSAATDLTQAARTVVTVEARENADVLLRVAVPPAPKTYVFLSAIEVSRSGESEAVLWSELVMPRTPRPAPGAQDVAPDALLSWADTAEAVRWDISVGLAAAALQPVGPDLERSAWAGRFGLGQTVFWRVTGRHGDQRFDGPVWRFATATALTIDDFEDYRPGYRLSDWWDDGRAGAPTRGPLIDLTADRGNALLIQHPGGQVAIRRALPDHPDWTIGGVTHLTLHYRDDTPSLQAGLRVRLVDAEGHDCELPLEAMERGLRAPWRVLAAPLDRAGNVTLKGLREMALQVTSARPGEIALDEIRLERLDTPGVAAAPTYQSARIGAVPGAPPEPVATPSEEVALRADVCVVGGGSGGIGAALAAARAGARVVLIEREGMLGGTSTAGGISNWEPGPGCSLAQEIFDRLRQRAPGVLCDKPTYAATLTRAGGGHIQFEPRAFHETVAEMLRATGTCRVLLNTTATEVTLDAEAKRLGSVRAVSRDGVAWRVRAGTFIDSTGSAFLCQAAGCDVMLGAEPKSRFGEAGAPEAATSRLNSLELVYRIRPAGDPPRQPLPAGQKPRRGGAAWPLPSGDRFVNACGGLAPGWMLVEQGYEQTRAELEQRALAHWHWLQGTEYPGYEFDSFAPMLAIRESHRVVGEYVLTENDLVAGVARQGLSDIIAIADHPMDTHGAAGGLRPVATPYGIPFRCLVPRGGWRNLLVACRGASFSHLAASSCRLSRTILALGHAAGLAAAQCAERGCDVPDVDIRAIQRDLSMPPPGP